MKSIIIISLLFFVNIVISQEDQDSIYKNAIALVKQSKDFQLYSKDDRLKKDNLKVSKYVWSICGNGTFFSEIIGKEIYKKCNYNWINDSLKEITSAKKLSDKGKKNYFIYFSDIYNSYFTANVSRLNNSNEELLILFKIENGNVSLIESKKVFTEVPTVR